MQTPDIPRPKFHADLPPERAMPRYQIIRTPANKKVPFLILCETEFIMPTHFVRKRTMPCFQPDPCAECQLGTEVRWKVYLSVFSPSTNVINILELTDHGGEPVVNYRKQIGSLRGKKITVWREGRRENSPVFSAIGNVLDNSIAIPASPDVQEFLYRMWYVKDNRETTPDDRSTGVNRVSNIVDEVNSRSLPHQNGNGKPKRKGH